MARVRRTSGSSYFFFRSSKFERPGVFKSKMLSKRHTVILNVRTFIFKLVKAPKRHISMSHVHCARCCLSNLIRAPTVMKFTFQNKCQFVLARQHTHYLKTYISQSENVNTTEEVLLPYNLFYLYCEQSPRSSSLCFKQLPRQLK